MPELLELPVPGKWKTVLTDSDLAAELAQSLKNTRRPVAIHAYGTGASRRYLLSWVKNSGVDFQDWGWTKGLTPGELSQKVDGAHDRLRLFLVEPIVDMKKLAAVWFIRDPSSSAPWLTWDWTPEIAATDLKNAVPAGHRLTCVRALKTGASKVAAIWTQDDSGAPWYWNPSITFDDLHDLLRDTKSRLVSLDNHGSGSSLRFCAAWVDNAGAEASPRTWFWFAGAKEAYLRGQSDGLCSHPVELCNLGGGNLAAILNRTPAPATPPDDVLLQVSGMSTVKAFSNEEAMNTQMDLEETVTVQVTNVAGADVEIVSAAMRWASSGGQSDALTPSLSNPTGGATAVPAGWHRQAPESSQPWRLRATSADVYFTLPVAVVLSAFGGPVKRMRLDFTEDPAHRTAPRIRTGLHDVSVLGSADLLREEIGRGIAPQDPPGVELRVVDPERRAIPIARAGQRLDSGMSVSQAWNHPDVLDGQTLQHPPCVNLAVAPMRRSIFEDRRNVHVPSTHNP